MSIRRRMSVFLGAASLMLGAGLFLTGLMPGASAQPLPGASASAQTGPVIRITICLTNARSYCADVKDSSNRSGQPVWLYSSSSARDYHWYEIPATCPGAVPGSNACIAFSDVQNTGLCMGDNGAKNVVLIRCSAEEAAWVFNANNHLRNATWGPQGDLAVTANANKRLLFTTYPGAARWERWSGYTVCTGC